MTGPTPGRRGGRATLIAVAYSVVGVLPLFLVSAQAVQLQRALGFGTAELGLAVSLCFVASAAAAIPMGRLAGTIGPSRGLTVSASLSLASVAWMALVATAWWHVVVALMLCGVANATAQVSTNMGLAGGVRRERQGLAFGAKQAAVPMAGLLAGLAVPLVGLVAGWRAAFIVAAAIIAGLVVRRPGFGDAGASRRHAALGRPTPLLVLTGLAGLLAGAVGNSLPAFTVDAAVDRGIDESAAGVLLALGSAAAMTGRIGAGWVADRRGGAGYAEMAALTAAGAVALAVLSASGSSRVLFVVTILAAFACAWGWPGLIYYATVRSHPASPAAASGFVLSSVYVGNIVGPSVVGFVADHRSYGMAWALTAGVLVLASLAAASAGRADQARTHAGPSGRSARAGNVSGDQPASEPVGS